MSRGKFKSNFIWGGEWTFCDQLEKRLDLVKRSEGFLCLFHRNVTLKRTKFKMLQVSLWFIVNYENFRTIELIILL